MATITSVTAREIIDSTAVPTIETTITLDDGTISVSSVPSSGKTGPYEAQEVRDTTENRYAGLGVKHEIEAINTTISAAVIGNEITQQQKIDGILIALDGTPNKGHLGANTLLSVSQAVLKAAAASTHIPVWAYIRQLVSDQNTHRSMPIPLFALIEGGQHGANSIEFQEFLVIPASSKTFEESLEIGVSVYQSTKKFLADHNASTLVSNQGGFSPSLASNRDALNMLKLSIEQSPYKFALDVFLGIDCSANFFRKDKVYSIKDKNVPLQSSDLVTFYHELLNDFSILYLEDPFAEDDWDGWKKLFSELGDKLSVIGDDLTVTNPYRIQMALDHNVLNGINVKPIQIGTITETFAVIAIARFKNLKIVVSDRTSDTNDDFIADYAVGVGADYVKFGAPVRERVNRYNRMLAISQEMKTKTS